MTLEDKDFILKMVLVGDGAVGKTSLRMRYLGYGFDAEYMEAIGADFAVKTEIIDEKIIDFQIWDLAGQPEFQEVRSTYYAYAHVALLVFDITRHQTFENLSLWIEEIWKHNGRGVIPVVVLGNKDDLRDIAPSCIEENEATKYCIEVSETIKETGIEIKFLKTSAKTGLNVSEAFQTLGKAFLDSIHRNQMR